RSRFHGSDVDMRPDRAADRVDLDELARSADRRPYAPVCGGDRGGVGADDEVAFDTAVGTHPEKARDADRYPHRCVRESDPFRAPALLAEDTKVSLVQRTRPDGLAGTGVDGGQRAALVPTCDPDAAGSVSEGKWVAVQAVGAKHVSRPIVDPREGA